MDYSGERHRFVEWLRQQMTGPTTADDLLVNMSPLDRYPCGVLSPIINAEEGIDPAGDAEEEDDDDAPMDARDPDENVRRVKRRRRYVPPSSVGFSFFIQGGAWELQVGFSAAKYQRTGDRDNRGRFIRREYNRISMGGDEYAVSFTKAGRVDVMGGAAGIDVQARPHANGQIITISLFNKQELQDNRGPMPIDHYERRCGKSLFEVKLWCYLERGEIGIYPRVEYSLLNEEEQELELQYSRRQIYAVGHGAAADWRSENGVVKRICSDFIPVVEVPRITAEGAKAGGRGLQINFLSSLAEKREIVIDELEKFVAGYADWSHEQEKQAADLEEPEQNVGKRITRRMKVAVKRMRDGIALLRRDNMAAQAFALANRAMLNQLRQGSTQDKPDEFYRWRPFQLAFLLATIKSTLDEDDGYRDTLDLIWFPTGGGKTEAYLGLIACLVVWRRLKYPDTGGGTAALMRYTLRLLTAQQYQRAARMICALELIRQQPHGAILGKEPITVGLWVGNAASPNTFKQALEITKKAQGNNDAAKELVLDKCPWCDDKFIFGRNYRARQNSFEFHCTNNDCDFGSNGYGPIPCNVVDEALYRSPPSLLIATVDKFARLAWEERASSFFGNVKDRKRPPELIIQDELHLIAGALGSIAGIYEAAVHTVLASHGVYPKYIASTATIRMADDQVKMLYGSPVSVFPPPGLSYEDSYFARTVPINQEPGRMYVGYLAPTLDRQHCIGPLSAVLLAAPSVMFSEQGDDGAEWLDAWWTLVVYHGSLKAVGSSHNAFSVSVREFCKRLAEEHRQDANNDAGLPSFRLTPRIAQLTSIASAAENANTFARLGLSHTNPNALDVVLATNMVSVGLDVERLALMVINGQPLTTAEYIQASSRVGRGDIPGIVCVNYFRDQARSLSHYENFRPYHESFYRFVEPSSVTPYTYQARRRALHAALVIAIRHSCRNLLANDTAGNFDPRDERVRSVVKRLKDRCAKSDKSQSEAISDHIEALIQEWHDKVQQVNRHKRQLNYQGSKSDRANERLLFEHDDNIQGLWSTLQSMRNVEKSSLLKVT